MSEEEEYREEVLKHYYPPRIDRLALKELIYIPSDVKKLVEFFSRCVRNPKLARETERENPGFFTTAFIALMDKHVPFAYLRDRDKRWLAETRAIIRNWEITGHPELAALEALNAYSYIQESKASEGWFGRLLFAPHTLGRRLRRGLFKR